MSSEAKRLLEQATPLPWQMESISGSSVAIPAGGLGGYWSNEVRSDAAHADAALIVYAVNRLPDYEALREVTEGLTLATDPQVRAYLTDKALDLLRRLREPVPA